VTALAVTHQLGRAAQAPGEEPPLPYRVVVGGLQGVLKVLDPELAEFNLYKVEHGLRCCRWTGTSPSVSTS